METAELTYLMYGTEHGDLIIGPAVMIEGQLWLVSKWHEAPVQQFWLPAIAIRLPMDRVQATPNRSDFHYMLSGSVPKEALDGKASAPQGAQFEVVAEPAFRVPVPAVQ